MADDRSSEALAHFKEVLAWDWEDNTVNEGIAIKSKAYKDSSVTAFYGEHVVPGNAQKLSNVLWDADLKLYQRWDPKCAEWRILEKINDDSRIEYTLQNLPWPVWDRDFVHIHSRKQEGEKIYQWYVWTEHKDAPEQPKKLVRGKVSIAGWVLEPADGKTAADCEKVKITRCFHISPEGSLPGMLVSKLAAKQIAGFIQSLAKEA